MHGPSNRLWTEATEADRHDLRFAKILLENPGLAARVAHVLGSPIEKGMQMLPREWSDPLQEGVRRALFKALEIAIATLGQKSVQRSSSDWWHKALVGASGTIGGAFGLASFAFELPISTTLMLRSIADIARAEGFDVSNLDTKLNCLQVFALGGTGSGDNATETGYWGVRAALSQAVQEAAGFIARGGMIERGAPAIARLITAIASRFGVVVTEQAAAKAIPLVGAASGAVINILFIDHFQDMARGHFIIQRLEAKYGRESVEKAYRALRPEI